MSKLMQWLRPASASREDLEKQLSEARQAVEQARRGLAESETAFDVDGSPEAERKVAAAQVDLERAELHHARASRLVEARKQAERDAERAKLVARRDELQATLEHGALVAERAASLTAEIDAIVAASKAREQRSAVEDAITARRYELNKTLGALGEQTISMSFNSGRVDNYAVGEALEMIVAELPKGPARDYLRGLVLHLAPNTELVRMHVSLPPPERSTIEGAA